MRLGVGGLGSIPGTLLVSLAFVVLVIVRFASLVLGSAKPEAARRDKGKKVMSMAQWKLLLASMLETAWAGAVSVLAGLLLLI